MLPSREATPLYNALLEKLSNAGDEDAMERLADFCLHKDLKFKQPYGSAEQPADKQDDPYQLGLRMEHLLEVTDKQRNYQIARLRARKEHRALSPHTLIFNEEDMKEILNEWRKRPRTWMTQQSLDMIEDYRSGTRQDTHQAIKSRFSTMLFHLFGNKALVELFVRFPICSTEQPAEFLTTFAQDWQSIRDSPDHKTARDNARPNPGGVRISKQIHDLERKLQRRQLIEKWLYRDGYRWEELNRQDQFLWWQCASEITCQITALRQRQQPPYAGTAARLVHNSHRDSAHRSDLTTDPNAAHLQKEGATVLAEKLGLEDTAGQIEMRFQMGGSNDNATDRT